jgi:ABC-type amino acid transport substrate-binding protein
MTGVTARRSGLALALVLLASACLAAETIDRVLAVVAGQLIMLSDVAAVRDLGIIMPAAGADPVGSVLGKMIDRELMLAEVDRYAPPEPEASEIDREVAAVRARFPSEKAYSDVLARSGFDPAHVREIVRQNLRLRAYFDQRFIAPDGDEQRRQTLIDEWVASLRRRTPVINLYQK